MILVANYEGTCGVRTAYECLKKGNDSLRSIIDGIKLVEANPEIRTVGRGGWPNILGEVELDACVMDGDTLKTGAVGGLKGYLHPVEVAYNVFRKLKHEILIGEGAARFANDIGAEKADNLTEDSAKKWRNHLEESLDHEQKKKFPDIQLYKISSEAVDPEKLFDTTVYLAKDSSGRISTATSTSGWAWKHPGRLGDSPIIGAGSYADSRYGACACTHTGEMAIRCCTARSVVLYMKMGMSVTEAVYEAARDLEKLRGGYVAELTIHAIDAKDNFKVINYRGAEEVRYWVWKDGIAEPLVETAEYVE